MTRRDESLAWRVVTRPHDWSPLSLRAPVTVTGTLSEPQVGIESKGLVGRVLGAAVGPAAAVLPLTEQGSNSDNDPCADPKAPAAAGAHSSRH